MTLEDALMGTCFFLLERERKREGERELVWNEGNDNLEGGLPAAPPPIEAKQVGVA